MLESDLCKNPVMGMTNALRVLVPKAGLVVFIGDACFCVVSLLLLLTSCKLSRSADVSTVVVYGILGGCVYLARLPENYEVWLVGGGERMETVQRLATDLGIGDRVRFLGVRTDVPALLKSSEVIVMSSHWEGLSLSNIEGMSASRPFIASDVDGLREVTAGYGLLFPHRDDAALAELLIRLHDDHAFYAATAEACYRRALDFDIASTAKAYNEVYLRIYSSRQYNP